ncbi:MAG: sigma-70 family RNA polymerase sigma factor [Planctomycetota bacterium]
MSSGDLNSPTTSKSLLLRIRDQKDEQSWRTFETIYGQIVRSYCIQKKLQPSDTDDIVQEVLTAVSKAIRSFEYDPSKGKFRGWLGTITANKIKDFLHRKSRRRESLMPMGVEDTRVHHQFADPDNDWVKIFSERVYQEACRRVRPDFQERAWLCFELTWTRMIPAAQVGSQLELPIHSVYVNKSRVIKRLEKEIRMLAEDLAFDFSVEPEADEPSVD